MALEVSASSKSERPCFFASMREILALLSENPDFIKLCLRRVRSCGFRPKMERGDERKGWGTCLVEASERVCGGMGVKRMIEEAPSKFFFLPNLSMKNY